MELKKQLIISIGREYGSGGHRIAEELAKRFGLTFYDYHMLGEIALDKKVDVKTLEKFDELPKIPFFSRTVKGYSNSPQENIANLQFDFLRKKADEGESFVIVGRCAETILKENPNLISFFVLGICRTRLNVPCSVKVYPEEKPRNCSHVMIVSVRRTTIITVRPNGVTPEDMISVLTAADWDLMAQLI